MTFISYAQNYEDVMLWRALQRAENGFYIDVGAGHPDDYSVTRAFYDRGWRGINVEPTNRFVRLAGSRPLDVNIQAAVGHVPDKLTLFVVEDNKDISTLDPIIAGNHRTAGFRVSESTVPVVTLADICRDHVRSDINFLKIDVEGAERDVLLGADFAQFRPWIVVIEATVPNSQVLTYAAWEELLTNNEYRFAWFDGLNRFYLAVERWDQLAMAFTAPPNVFDDFVRAADTEQLNRIVAAESRAAILGTRLAEADRAAAEADARAKRAEQAAAEAETIALCTTKQNSELVARAQAAEERAQAAEEHAQAAEERAQAVEQRLQRARVVEERAAAAWRRTAIAEASVAKAAVEVENAKATEAAARDWLQAMRASTSWKLTKPLREFGRLVQHWQMGLARDRTPTETIADPATRPPPEQTSAPSAVVVQDLTYNAIYKRRNDQAVSSTAPLGHGRVLLDLSTSLAWRGVHAVGIVRTERELGIRLLGDPELAVLPVVFHGSALRLLDRDFARGILTERTVTSSAAGAIASTDQTETPDLSLVVYPRHGDILFCAGLGWDVIDWAVVESLRHACNLRLVSVLYDLIPVKFPEMIPQSTDHYMNYFLHLLDECDLAFCISDCSRRDLLDFASEMGRPKPETEILQLGAGVPAPASADEFADPVLRERLRRGRFALSVGTFEIRKNYRLLIDLWHELVDSSTFDLDLVIVGMAGWGVDETLQQLRSSPLLGSRIFWLQGISDAGLSWLYETCHVLLYPSLYEGWGLPVVEALQRGRPVVASNRGAIPEASMGAATIIDPDDRSAWRCAIIVEAQAPRRQVLVEDIPSWDHASRIVKNRLSALILQEEVNP
jgi:FkbM family methyltransferase